MDLIIKAIGKMVKGMAKENMSLLMAMNIEGHSKTVLFKELEILKLLMESDIKENG